MSSELDTLKKELHSQDTRIHILETQLENLKENLEEVKEENDKMKTENKKLRTEVGDKITSFKNWIVTSILLTFIIGMGGQTAFFLNVYEKIHTNRLLIEGEKIKENKKSQKKINHILNDSDYVQCTQQ